MLHFYPILCIWCCHPWQRTSTRVLRSKEINVRGEKKLLHPPHPAEPALSDTSHVVHQDSPISSLWMWFTSITSAAHRALKMIDFFAVQRIDSIDVDETLKRGFRSKNVHMARSLSCYWAFSLSAKATASLFICCTLLIGSQVFIFPMFGACVILLVHQLELKNGCL